MFSSTMAEFFKVFNLFFFFFLKYRQRNLFTWENKSYVVVKADSTHGLLVCGDTVKESGEALHIKEICYMLRQDRDR